MFLGVAGGFAEMYKYEQADKNLRRLSVAGDVILGLILIGDLVYTKVVSNRISKLQGQLDSLYKNINSEKNKKDDKLLDRK